MGIFQKLKEERERQKAEEARRNQELAEQVVEFLMEQARVLEKDEFKIRYNKLSSKFHGFLGNYDAQRIAKRMGIELYKFPGFVNIEVKIIPPSDSELRDITIFFINWPPSPTVRSRAVGEDFVNLYNLLGVKIVRSTWYFLLYQGVKKFYLLLLKKSIKHCFFS